MYDDPADFAKLDTLINAHPPTEGPADLQTRVMQSIADIPPTTTLWYLQALQWLAAGVGILFTLGRLFGYIFSAWISIELAG